MVSGVDVKHRMYVVWLAWRSYAISFFNTFFTETIQVHVQLVDTKPRDRPEISDGRSFYPPRLLLLALIHNYQASPPLL